MAPLRILRILALAVALLSLAACGAEEEPPPDEAEALRSAVTADGILQHARRFEEVAAANGGNRAAGTPGYDASAGYVAEELRRAGYAVEVQPFEVPYYEELVPARLELVAPDERPYQEGEDFSTLQFSGSGAVVAPVRPVDLGEPGDSSSGCEAVDFERLVRGEVALIRRGGCPFEEKALRAEEAGASAVVIFNEGGRGRTGILEGGTLGEPGIGIPVVGASLAVGEDLARLAGEGDAAVRVAASTVSGSRETTNVIAETRTGTEDGTVMVGAHLDSVPEGPGINDNGSGSATVLEIARQMSGLGIEPRKKIRFAFWGAEEIGLIGSTGYVDGLPEEELDQIGAYLNFDMLGSPNHVRFVYDGASGPRGSGRIEEAFLDFFASQNLEARTDSTLEGRSDHGPFADAGVPVGGLFTGAEGTKTEEEAALFGGEAGEPHDPCYHQACDTAENLSPRALDEMSDAAAQATLVLANEE
ncbi:M20/M25/M40 family metallo-hydrolase [Rubrobacter marinus]|uniref:M20/M25/M40 family metallo-hydrolase n=1 Tax=Rubrobacter marinus TaxID=2653852 RepID=A0A6G8PXR8_9ACTN|nr:M20/M25/M40 family metallo-hydrolase [Rubrobacter marinus]QIN79003.1 M20/M25/M40 family metallo-hydrolase [Rubrobacter marinus]